MKAIKTPTVFGNFYFCLIGSITQFLLVDLEY
jgi:hypothetical protein